MLKKGFPAGKFPTGNSPWQRLLDSLIPDLGHRTQGIMEAAERARAVEKVGLVVRRALLYDRSSQCSELSSSSRRRWQALAEGFDLRGASTLFLVLSTACSLTAGVIIWAVEGAVEESGDTSNAHQDAETRAGMHFAAAHSSNGSVFDYDASCFFRLDCRRRGQAKETRCFAAPDAWAAGKARGGNGRLLPLASASESGSVRVLRSGYYYYTVQVATAVGAAAALSCIDLAVSRLSLADGGRGGWAEVLSKVQTTLERGDPPVAAAAAAVLHTSRMVELERGDELSVLPRCRSCSSSSSASCALSRGSGCDGFGGESYLSLHLVATAS